MTIINKLLLNKISFYALLISSAFAILLWSPIVLGRQLSHWTKIYIYLLPWVMVCLSCFSQVLINKKHRFEIILIVSIIILGVFNAALSDAVSRSTVHMRIFLVTGIFALWATMFLIDSEDRRRVFDWFCCGCMALIVPVEIIWWLIRDPNHDQVFHIFVLHAIPLGTLLILLSPGPVRLLASKHNKIKYSGLVIAFSGLLLILFANKRGTWLALAAMAAITLFYLVRKRRPLLAILLVVMALLLAFQAKRIYTRLDPSVNRYASVLQRLELYNFALHIWETHPFMGIGLRPLTHANYLKDYQQYNKDLVDFNRSVAKLQTLDNMLLTGFVELGSLMTLAYLILITYILVRYTLALRRSPTSMTINWYRLLVILGVAIHSMSYDALLFPSVNWLFHVQLGIMAGYYGSDKSLAHSILRNEPLPEGAL